MVKRPAKKKASRRPAKKTSTGTRERTKQTSNHLPVSDGQENDDDPWITISEVARQIKRPRSTVHRWCVEGLMKAARRRPYGTICVRFSEAMKFTEMSALDVQLKLPEPLPAPAKVDKHEPVRSADTRSENGGAYER